MSTVKEPVAILKGKGNLASLMEEGNKSTNYVSLYQHHFYPLGLRIQVDIQWCFLGGLINYNSMSF